MNIVYVFADSEKEYNCSQWNCVGPAAAINQLGNHKADAIYIHDFVTNSEKAVDVCSKADIIIVERNFFHDTLTMIQFWKVRGKTIIGIFDDAYDRMHPANISYPFWTLGEIQYKDQDDKIKTGYMNPKPLEQFVWGLKMMKAIQVPSVNLAADWGKYTPAHYVHNYLEIEKYGEVEPLIPHDELVVGWCGTVSHYSSFTDSGVVEAIRKVSKRYPNVKFLIGGDKRVFDLLDTKNKVFQSYVPPEQWTALLKTIDIGLAPLSGEYDKRRSWIKVLEYMALDIPWLATDYITYAEVKDYGKVTENGYKNWEASLCDMIDNYPAHKEKAKTIAHDFAMEQTLEKNVEKVHIPLYKKLVESNYP